MIRRLWHFWVVGHRWEVVSSVFNPGLFSRGMFNLIDRDNHGFTEVLLRCECGGHKTLRPIGDHATGKDLAELERLARRK